MSRSLLFLSAAALAAIAPEAATACPVCLGGGEQSRDAFVVTTVLLSALPPAMIGALVFWIWRRSRIQEQQRESARAVERAPRVGAVSNSG